jgi:hypothetical protein
LRADNRDAGIAEDRRDWAKSFGLIERGGHLARVGDVGRHGERGGSSGTALLCGCLQIVAMEGDERDGRTLLRESKRGGATDSGAGASDKGNAIGETRHPSSVASRAHTGAVHLATPERSVPLEKIAKYRAVRNVRRSSGG